MTGGRRIGFAVLASLLAAAATVRAHAQPRGPQVIERVVAVVNEDAIWLSELRRRAVPFLERVLSASSELERDAAMEALYGQLLTQLVDEQLIQQASREMQVRVTTEDVQRAIENVQRQSGLADDEFWNAVRAQGFTEQQYREDVRRQLLRLKVLNTRARGRVNLTEEDVRRKYDEMVRQANRDACFDVSMIKLDVPAGASATRVAEVRTQAEELHSRLTARSFLELGGTHLGEVCQGQLQPELQRIIQGLRPGQISEPQRHEDAYFLFHLRRRAEGGANIPGFEQVKQDLYRQMLEQAMARQEEIFLEELRRQAVIDRRL